MASCMFLLEKRWCICTLPWRVQWWYSNYESEVKGLWEALWTPRKQESVEYSLTQVSGAWVCFDSFQAFTGKVCSLSKSWVKLCPPLHPEKGPMGVNEATIWCFMEKLHCPLLPVYFFFFL